MPKDLEHFDSNKLYILDGYALNLFWDIASRLGSGDKLSDDQRRDMMNLMICRLDDAILFT